MSTLTARERDAVIRTIYGEARGESEKGMLAVAYVIKNRVDDYRWADDAVGVVTAKAQFSAWNKKDVNYEKIQNLPTKSKIYQAIGHIVDSVWDGIHDPTNGAVYYYAPRGMKGGKAPYWWNEALEESDGRQVNIGNHIFAGKVKRNKPIKTAQETLAVQKREASLKPKKTVRTTKNK